MYKVKVSTVLLVFVFLGFFVASFNLLSSFLDHNNPPITKIGISDIPEFVSNSSEDIKERPKSDRRYHVALTATAFPYSQWQSRILYYSYKKVKDLPTSDMGAFTRILHSGRADHLMDEIPTVVVSSLPDGQDRGYPPLNRPWAFVQWMEIANFEEEYVLMVEPDHIFVKPLPNLAYGELPAAYHFSYMNLDEARAACVRKFYPEERGTLNDIDPTGSSPVIMKKHILKKIASSWLYLTMKMKDDPECTKVIGWVMEMHSYTVASAIHGVRHILHKNFIVQPPSDTKIGDAYIIHYTYGMDYTLKGEPTPGKFGEWRFDKRSYTTAPPKNLTMPPQGVPETVVRVIETVNEVSANLPNWDIL